MCGASPPRVVYQDPNAEAEKSANEAVKAANADASIRRKRKKSSSLLASGAQGAFDSGNSLLSSGAQSSKNKILGA